MPDTYHHGSLRTDFLTAAATTIANDGVAALSLRSVAESLGVSHTAPRHHFGSRSGLLTALAVEGFDALADRLEAVRGDGFAAVAVGYVAWSVEHPGHFAVMWTPSLLDRDAASLTTARARTFAVLHGGAGRVTDLSPSAMTAAWALVHGLASLLLSGGLAESGLVADSDDVAATTLRAAAHLFTPHESERS